MGDGRLRMHFADFTDAKNFVRRFKTLSGLTPYEYITKVWTFETDRFIASPIHQLPGANNYARPEKGRTQTP